MSKIKKNGEDTETEEDKIEDKKCSTEVTSCRRLPVEYSASSIQRNLAVAFDPPELRENQPISSSIGYVHKGSFIIYHLHGDYQRKLEHSPKEPIHFSELTRLSDPNIQANKLSKGTVILQARWLNVSHGQILLLGSITGIYFFSSDGTKPLGKLENSLGLTGYSRAATASGNTIFAGTDSGDVVCFEYDHLKGCVTYLYQKEKLHLSSIQDMFSNTQLLASGDASGGIKILRPQDFSVMSEFIAADDCVTGCILSGNVVIGSYASGVVRIFDLKSKELSVLIKAHSRWIVSLDINVKQTLLLTVSEDNTARLWKIRDKVGDKEKPNLDELASQPKLVSCVTVKNQVLVGGCFLDPGGNYFALTSYAEKHILVCPVAPHHP